MSLRPQYRSNVTYKNWPLCYEQVINMLRVHTHTCRFAFLKPVNPTTITETINYSYSWLVIDANINVWPCYASRVPVKHAKYRTWHSFHSSWSGQWVVGPKSVNTDYDDKESDVVHSYASYRKWSIYIATPQLATDSDCPALLLWNTAR